MSVVILIFSGLKLENKFFYVVFLKANVGNEVDTSALYLNKINPNGLILVQRFAIATVWIWKINKHNKKSKYVSTFYNNVYNFFMDDYECLFSSALATCARGRHKYGIFYYH